MEMSLFFIKTHVFRFVSTDMLANDNCWLLQKMQHGLSFGMCIARRSMSSVEPESVIVSAGYRLLLAYFSVKPFSFIRSVDVQRRNLGRLWTDMGLMYHLAEHQQQCQWSLCLHRLSCVFFTIIMAVTVSLERPYTRSIWSIFTLSMEAKAFEKSTSKRVARRFSARTPSRFNGLSESVML